MSDTRHPIERCTWPSSELDIAYHDAEWGVPVHDDRTLFEFLTLEGAQAGLSWSTVLKKRENYRRAFAEFDPARVARFPKKKVEQLMLDPGIIRNRLKIESTVSNARAFLEVRKEFSSFDRYIWQFVNGRPKQNAWKAMRDIPSATVESNAMSKDLKRRGFRFVGTTICYAFMQAVGMVNDHLTTCYRYKQLKVVLFFFALTTISACTSKPATPAQDTTSAVTLMPPGELEKLPSKPADKRIAYGKDSSQYGELRIPSGSGPHPVAVLIHGGCFKAAYATLRDLTPMADALKDMGIATWTIEYRRTGQPGGGWPGTYLDVGNAVDHLRKIATENALDLHRVVIVGHSAGGNLAMWASARARVPVGSALHMNNPLPVRGVLNLAGPVDLTANIAGYEGLCRDSVITTLMGGTPASVPDRYAQASPIKLVPSGIPQVLLVGEHEEFVPRPIAENYVSAAAQAGDSIRLVVIPRVGHFEIASPVSTTWPQVSSVIRSLLDGRLPAK